MRSQSRGLTYSGRENIASPWLFFFVHTFRMYLLYSDESGSVKDASQKYFVLAGFCLFERQGYWLSKELDAIATRFNAADPNSVELHGSPMFGGRSFWRQFPIAVRHQAMIDALSLLNSSAKSNRLFVCVVNKVKASPHDPVEMTFEQIISRFDQYLMRLHKGRQTERGVVIFDKSTYEETIQNLATDFRTIGHTWGVVRNLAEVLLFLDSKASRLIQLADLIAYAAFRKYEKGDDRFFSVIESRIDREGGAMHGLYELL